MTAAQIKYMVDRFLGWKLPENFNPDAGISFKKFFNEHAPWGPQKNEPTGTNLFDATQAEEMIRYLVDGMPTEAMTNSQDVHAALRKACKSAAKKLFPDGFDTEFRMLAARAVTEKIIEKELTPVVEALVAGAYKACAEHLRDWNFKKQIIEDILALTPESAARALREHDNALIERCIKIVEETKVTHGDHYGTYQALSLDAPELIRAIRTLSHPVEEEK